MSHEKKIRIERENGIVTYISEETWNSLLKRLDEPAKEKPELKKLLQTKPPWEKSEI